MTASFFVYMVVFLVFFALTEVLKRKFDLRPEFTRKIVHFGSSSLIVSMPFFLDRYEIIVLAMLFILLLAFTRRYHLFLSVQGVKRKTIGEFTFAASAGVAAVFFLPQNPESFMVGFVVLGISDTVAQLSGERFPTKKFNVLSQTKSLGGFLGFVLSTAVVLTVSLVYFQTELHLIRIVIACLILGIVESSQVFGLDNLFIPLSTGLVWEFMLTSG